MSDDKRNERTEKMLKLIEERLNAYTVEETIERLHSYEGTGPTVDEFIESFNLPEKPQK